MALALVPLPCAIVQMHKWVSPAISFFVEYHELAASRGAKNF